MPSTAADVARRLDIEDPKLTDPVVNLRIGGYHLSWLRERFDELTPALFAYNAGGTRVRSWEREHGDLPHLLFAEAVPFSETRNYIRKVLVSAVYYGYLYGDVPMAETVQQFFPNY
jgi:soluble lytic murein transglycosylase-like protein